MRSKWENKPISEIVEFNPKHTIKKGSIVPYVEMAAVPEHSREIAYFEEREFKGGGSKFKNGDTLFSRITPCLQNGKTSRVSGLDEIHVANGSTEFIVMSAKDYDNDKDFVYYLTLDKEFRKYAEGRMEGTTGRQRVSWQALAEYELPIPPKENRKKIAHILSTLDDKIELNRKMNETLEAMAQAIFKSWFVDFDPVHVKANCKSEAELELAAKELGISKEVLTLFPSEFEESEMGMIPERWSHDVLGSFVEILDSKRVPLAKNERAKRKGNIPYYGATSVMDYVDDYIFNEPLTLLGEDGSVVRDDGTPFMQYIWEKAWVNNHAHVIKSKSDLSTEAIYVALQKQNVTMFVTGAVQPKINQTNLKKIPIIKPNGTLHKVYSELISPMFSKIRQLTDENKTLIKIRDTLLPKLLSGELDVSKVKYE